MQSPDDVMMDADQYFGDPEANGDVTNPNVGDVDSEYAGSDQDDDLDDIGVDGQDEDSDESGLGEGLSDDEGDAEDWLLDGRFRKGEEDKLAKSYAELESFHSRTVNELRDQIAAERDAAFRQAKELLAQPKHEPSALEKAQQRAQLMGLAFHDPGAAYQAAVETGDDSAVEAVLNAIGNPEASLDYDGDPQTAAALRIQYESQKQTARMSEMQNEIQQQRAEVNVERGYATFERQNAELLQNEHFKNAFGQLVTERISTINADDPVKVMEFLDDCADRTFGRLARQQGFAAMTGGVASGADDPPVATQQRDTNAAKRRAANETTSRRNAPRGDTKPSIEEAYADDLLAVARKARPTF